MPRAASSRRFAQAVFQLALENDEVDRWLDDLTLLADALGNQEFSELLDAPQVSVNQKTEVIRSALGGSVNQLALNLISLLASRNLALIMSDIVEQYQKLLDTHRGIERAEVVSAIPLDDSQRQQVSDLLQGIVGKEVRLNTRVEPQILGGFIARVGDRVIDGSTRTKLYEMRRGIVQRL